LSRGKGHFGMIKVIFGRITVGGCLFSMFLLTPALARDILKKKIGGLYETEL